MANPAVAGFGLKAAEAEDVAARAGVDAAMEALRAAIEKASKSGAALAVARHIAGR